MTVKAKYGLASAVPLIVAIGALVTAPAVADPLQFQKAPVSNVVSKLDGVFNISIVIRGPLDPATPITLDVPDSSAPSAVLTLVNQLSNDLGANFQKSFVISKVADAIPVSTVHVDTNSSIVFSDTTVNVNDAIQRVASLDGAAVHFADPLSGSVSLTDSTLTVADAANQIAQATHTRWQALYTLTPTTSTVPVDGKVVGWTNEGQKILQLPYSVYIAPPKPEMVKVDSTKTAADQQASATGETAKLNGAAGSSLGVPSAANPYGIGAYGQYNPYGAQDPSAGLFNSFGIDQYGFGNYSGALTTSNGAITVLPYTGY